MIRLAVVIMAMSLSGCWQSRGETTGRTKAVEHYEEHPTADGGKVATRTTTTEAVTETSAQSGVDPQVIANTVAAAVRGVAGGSGWGEIGTALGAATTLGMGAYAAAKRSQVASQTAMADFHRKDADEAWNRILDKHDANKDA